MNKTKSSKNRKQLFVILSVLMSLASAAAATNFTNNLGNNDFNNAGNWDNGLPGKAGPPLGTGGDAVVNAPATLTADFVQAAGDDGFTVFIGSGTSGDLTIPAGLTLYPTDGLDTGDKDTYIGVGAGGSGTFTIAGTYKAIGAGADMFIGDAAGGYGVVNILDSGTMEIRKTVEIINGKLTIGTAAAIGTGLQDELVVDNGGTLGFILDSASSEPRYHGVSLVLELGSTSSLELTLTGGYN